MPLPSSISNNLGTALKSLHVLLLAFVLTACGGESVELGLKLEASPLGEKTIDHHGRILKSHDVQLSMQNLLKNTPLFVRTVDIKYQSEYLKTRNPEKFSYTLEKLNGTRWQNTSGGYSGATRASQIAPGFKEEFIVPVFLELTGGSGTYRVKVSFTGYDDKDAKRHDAYSNEFNL